MNIQQFIENNKLSMTASRVEANPNYASTGITGSGGEKHWKCTIVKGDGIPTTRWDIEKIVVFFSQGSAHILPPILEDVLDCLASDSASIQNALGFEDWADEFGYDSDSRKAERIYETCKSQAKNLKNFLGEKAYETLLWEVERQ